MLVTYFRSNYGNFYIIGVNYPKKESISYRSIRRDNCHVTDLVKFRELDFLIAVYSPYINHYLQFGSYLFSIK